MMVFRFDIRFHDSADFVPFQQPSLDTIFLLQLENTRRECSAGRSHNRFSSVVQAEAHPNILSLTAFIN